jgi:hypothetical protein
MIGANIWGAFREMGLVFLIVDGVQRVRFNEIKLRESQGFMELWASDFSPDDLPARRRGARFERINSSQSTRLIQMFFDYVG